VSECYVLNAEAYPHDGESIAVHVMYAESEEKLKNHEFTNHRFFVLKDVAQSVSTQIMDILAAPDTATAWSNIMDDIPEANEPFEVEENKG
jgi:hypothetical protein